MPDPLVAVLIIVIVTELICLGVFWKGNFIPDLDLPSYIPLPGGRGVTTTARKITLAAISAVIVVSAVILLVAALT